MLRYQQVLVGPLSRGPFHPFFAGRTNSKRRFVILEVVWPGGATVFFPAPKTISVSAKGSLLPSPNAWFIAPIPQNGLVLEYSNLRSTNGRRLYRKTFKTSTEGVCKNDISSCHTKNFSCYASVFGYKYA